MHHPEDVHRLAMLLGSVLQILYCSAKNETIQDFSGKSSPFLRKSCSCLKINASKNAASKSRRFHAHQSENVFLASQVRTRIAPDHNRHPA